MTSAVIGPWWKATIGGFVRVNDEYYGLTTAHASPRFKAAILTWPNDLDDSSEDEDDVLEMTSKGASPTTLQVDNIKLCDLPPPTSLSKGLDWALILKTGCVYGQVVSGYPESASAYLVPAWQIVEDIREKLGHDVELPSLDREASRYTLPKKSLISTAIRTVPLIKGHTLQPPVQGDIIQPIATPRVNPGRVSYTWYCDECGFGCLRQKDENAMIESGSRSASPYDHSPTKRSSTKDKKKGRRN
ncbi:hypothetical protein BDZ45DRAFT_790456 [Acephala macrosclerotiorum]|nr:hypothetical protein BDZ45DRAFT_790456 [Acephala macrosclerotiorum]